MSGRLTLSWVNKDKALVPTDDGSYQWVERDDPRVTEVRLLQQRERVGDVTDGPEDNLLIRGDSYDALHALARTPEYAARYRGKVNLVYIDPPFNTNQAFEDYEDSLEHSVWLGMMRERLLLVRDLLADGGSVWVHLDDAEVAYCRVLMDEIFGRANFIATVVWKRRNDPRNTATHISADHDFILCYAKELGSTKFQHLPRTEAMDSAYVNPDGDLRGPWRRGDLAARNFYSKGLYPVTTPSGRLIAGPPSGSYWRVSEDELKRLDADGRIYWGPDGSSRPYLKRYLSEVKGGRVPSSVWHPEEVGFVRNGKEEVRALVGDVFATPKPERLLERVIQIATRPGDVVLDCFAGSGTTGAVAQKLNRKWVLVEASSLTVEKFTKPRLEKVVCGEDKGGVTKDVSWDGGGGFRVLEIGPSLYERFGSRLLLADWAKGEEFSRAVAAQLRFAYKADGPFCGSKGRTRLAVIDGVADDVVVRSVVSHLEEEERVTIVAKGASPEAAETLAWVSKGSRLLKAPADLTRSGRVVR
ncbi:site-specific DNA-methyltransferase [Micromonospora olivasterospora]|uniref:Adenine-specific DNA-methyltransferase n=1 Tax=Micromonospora olivasterospora TaxID=1880 RepID=A0A562I640_MICOL|nr:site-specific DNA-methyltransferase [Micromonospora olivasterospora]TWH66165.1 adenine-specific DNA-methyltransferase [Micromonospora olivasterospora]